MRHTILAAGILAASTAAAAEPAREDFEATTVASLSRLCSADESTTVGKYAIGFCYGWIEGVEQFYQALLAEERFDADPVACPGRVVSREETRQLFLDWVQKNPESGGMAPLEGMIRAASETFPCG